MRIMGMKAPPCVVLMTVYMIFREKASRAWGGDCLNHRENHLCSPAARAGEHEKLLEMDTPLGWESGGKSFMVW